ncbi:MAG TPA: GNAT family N-acetyltransferase [Gemmataceae bacterium]|nr:GNAT family N-acetyltransferase [Gemmataceae bacterium]
MPAFLETDRITLRQFTEDDAPLLLALDSDPEVMRYCGPYGLPDEAAYRERIRHYFQPYYAKGPRFGFWAAEEKATGRFIGWFHLRPALDYRFASEAGYHDGDYDIGFRLVQTAWRKGYATEVSLALLRSGFVEPEVRAIVAVVLVGNLASCRVLEKLGLRRVSEFPLPGFEMAAARYALAKADFGASLATP